MTEIVVRRPAKPHEAKLHEFITSQVWREEVTRTEIADEIFQHIIQKWSPSWDLIEEEMTTAQSDASFTAEG